MEVAIPIVVAQLNIQPFIEWFKGYLRNVFLELCTLMRLGSFRHPRPQRVGTSGQHGDTERNMLRLVATATYCHFYFSECDDTAATCALTTSPSPITMGMPQPQPNQRFHQPNDYPLSTLESS